MSTRCVINFCDGKEVISKIYRHSDGYPDGENGVPADLERFFGDVKNQCNGDNRFGDPVYLAAKYVVWEAGQNAREWDTTKRDFAPTPPLRFLGVGVLMENPWDIEYEYFVDCSTGCRPSVKWREVCKE